MPADDQKPLARSLSGRRIVVPESRELDLFTEMLEAQGAVTLRCPMVRILDLKDTALVEAWLDRLIAGLFDDLILLTGEGLRRLMTIARRSGRDEAAIAAIRKLRTITRGPKPVRALRELGLSPGLAAAEPTTAGVIETLEAQPLAGRTVGVQLYPGNRNELLTDFLRRAGAIPDAVLPYRYASDSDTAAVEAVIQEMAAGRVDAIAFTSSPPSPARLSYSDCRKSRQNVISKPHSPRLFGARKSPLSDRWSQRPSKRWARRSPSCRAQLFI
jgi:uroporphyrinogen-III synthase